MLYLTRILAPLLLWTQFGFTAPSAATSEACKEISTAIPGRVSYPASVAYISETSKYWSTVLREIQPACVVLPTSTEQVAITIQILNRYPDVNFAAKSGGHDPNPGHGSIQDGVLIAMREITGTVYSKDENIVYVSPGGEWNDVFEALDGQGVAVVGGRLGLVGIGGYLLQGGISFLSSQYGLAGDGIKSWEIVLPNGTIANIDAAEQPDLAVALRGSGSQFGIVTRFAMEAHPIGQVWGGIRIYDNKNADQIFEALHNFIPNGPEDPKAAIILTNVDAIGGLNPILIFLFYDGPAAPTDGALADFIKIPYISSTTKTQSYASLLKSNGEGAALLNSRISFRTFTVPYLKDHPEMYDEISKKWKEITAPYLDSPVALASQCSVDFQPFPAKIGAESQKRGGNALGISGDDGDRLLLELQCAWTSASDDSTLHQMSEDITSWLEGKLHEWLADEGMEYPYLPWLMNDAMGDQNVTGKYKDYAKLKSLQAQIDNKGLFKSRAGGFKY